MLRRAIGRLLHVDDRERIATYQRLLSSPDPPAVERLPEREQRILHMIVAALTDRVITRETRRQEAVDLLWAHPQVRSS